MAAALVNVERFVSSPRDIVIRKNFQNSCSVGSRRLQRSWSFSYTAQGLALGVTKLEQHGRNKIRIAMRAKRDASRNGGPRENRGSELKFDSTDMMELEFGRLLGEDRQTTLAKVLGKKVNPEITYVKFEKEKELQVQKESARRSLPSKISAPVRPDFKLQEKASDCSTPTLEPDVPDLISPPVRPPGFENIDASPVRKIRVAPSVRPGGGKKSVDADPYELEGLVRKPMRVSETEKGLPPARPEKNIIEPVLMRRKEAVPIDIQPKPGDSFLRRPSAVRLNVLGEPLTSDRTPPPESDEEVDSAGDVESGDVSEQRFRQLLDGELSPRRQGALSPVSKTSALKKVPSPVKPVLPSLEKKPIVLEKQQLVDSNENFTDQLSNNTSPGGAEDVTALQVAEPPNPQVAEPPNPQVKVSSRPRAILSKPPPVRQETTPEVTSVIEVPGDEKVGNTFKDVKTDDVISLEESTPEVQVAKSRPDNTSGESLAFCSKEVTTSANPAGEDTRLANVNVQILTKEDDTSEAVVRKPVMRLRKTSFPSEQSTLSLDNGSPVEFTSQETSSDTNLEVEKLASDSTFGRREEEGLIVGEGGIMKEQQDSTLPKSRQTAPGLRLSRPASPAAFTRKKDAQMDSALNNLQRAVSSFDERRIIPNKQENDEDWARAEALRASKTIEELDIIGTGGGGLLVGFGSLVGYLPAFELKAERRPVSFTSWAQTNDAETKKYPLDKENQNSGESTTIIRESAASGVAQETGGLVESLEQRSSRAVDPMLLEQFKKERAASLSLLVGQKAKVIVTSVDRTLRQLRFSEKQAEGEDQEFFDRKIALMESLNVGDVVTCQVKKITTFGAFVDLQGVPALIHSSEISWNRNVDPLAVLRVGQDVRAKVCKLDRYLQRINLSLKLMQPDPLLETLESLVSPDTIGSSAVVESQMGENEELRRFIGDLERIPEIAAVRSGRRVRGAALAPAFQIYLSGPLDNGYKLLARFGNEVQEVLVETSADRERMKDFIRDCTVQDT